MSIKDQINYLKKVKNKKISRQELEDYLVLIIQDNFFNLPVIPKVQFLDIANAEAYYDNNTITFNNEALTKVLENERSIISLFDSLGHESRHHWQEHSGIDEYLLDHQDLYYQELSKSLKVNQRDFTTFHFIRSLRDYLVFESSKVKFNIKNKNPNMVHWVNKIDRSKIFALEKKIEESMYYSQKDEEDAYFGGILFTSMLLNRYKEYCLKNNQLKLLKYIEGLNEDFDKIIERYKVQVETYDCYQDFKHAFDDVSIDLIEELHKITNNKNLSKFSRKFYNAMLDMYLNKYIEQMPGKESEKLLIDKSTHLFKEGMVDQFDLLFLEKIVKANIDKKAKQEIAIRILFKYVDNKNFNKYEFSEKDFLLTYLYVNDIITENMFNAIINELDKQNRDFEAIGLLKTTQARNKVLCYGNADIKMMDCLKNRWKLIVKQYLIQTNKPVEAEQKKMFAIYLEDVIRDVETFAEWYAKIEDLSLEQAKEIAYQKIGFDEQLCLEIKNKYQSQIKSKTYQQKLNDALFEKE